LWGSHCQDFAAGPFTVHETNSNRSQFHEKCSLAKENGREDAQLAGSPHSLLPANDGRTAPVSIARQARASSNFF